VKKFDKWRKINDKFRIFAEIKQFMKKDLNYESQEEPSKNMLNEPTIGYLISTSRQGIPFNTFIKMTEKSSFSLDDWSAFLHLSERTMQRYKKEKKAFDPIHSEKILEISMLYSRGSEVFGNSEKFNIWLNAKSIALGGIKPKDLLDNTFGIGLLKNELTRIEHGVLA
jgi:putative toxin-antitoxin system antitoxin component (TIGR02293 family)